VATCSLRSTWRLAAPQLGHDVRSAGPGGAELPRRAGTPATRRHTRPRDPEILTKDPELDATEIQVEVERGAVTLTGAVDSREAKLLAGELVGSVAGVREVHNGLTAMR
jgi:hypothetical protein